MVLDPWHPDSVVPEAGPATTEIERSCSERRERMSMGDGDRDGDGGKRERHNEKEQKKSRVISCAVGGAVIEISWTPRHTSNPSLLLVVWLPVSVGSLNMDTAPAPAPAKSACTLNMYICILFTIFPMQTSVSSRKRRVPCYSILLACPFPTTPSP